MSHEASVMEDAYVLLNPGPVNTTPRVRRSLLRPDLCHREEEFSQLLRNVRGNLLSAFGLEEEYTAVFLTGSGTAALEASLTSCLDPSKKVLVLSNGVYGERIEKIAGIHGYRRLTLRAGIGEPFELKDIERMLVSDDEIAAVAMVHHETSTGMLNPVNEICQLDAMRGRRMLLDAVSSLGGEALDPASSGIQVCACTANKCLQGLPGVSFVLLHRDELERMKAYPEKSLYLDLRNYWNHQEQGMVPFTPAIPAFYALDAALEELREEGAGNRIERYRNYSRFLRAGFERLGLEYLISPRYHSNTLTALKLPAHMTYETLHDRLKEEGFVIYAGQNTLKERIFRVANMGNLSMRDLEAFLSCLEEIIKL